MYAVKIFTLYPETFPGPLAGGIYGKAMRNGLWSLKTVNIRDYADDKHKTVDDTVFGGGSGMLMKPDIVANSLDKNISKGEKIFYLSPKGKKFNQDFANSLSTTGNFTNAANAGLLDICSNCNSLCDLTSFFIRDSVPLDFTSKSPFTDGS